MQGLELWFNTPGQQKYASLLKNIFKLARAYISMGYSVTFQYMYSVCNGEVRAMAISSPQTFIIPLCWELSTAGSI
jgi:hypothetical protein